MEELCSRIQKFGALCHCHGKNCITLFLAQCAGLYCYKWHPKTISITLNVVATDESAAMDVFVDFYNHLFFLVVNPFLLNAMLTLLLVTWTYISFLDLNFSYTQLCHFSQLNPESLVVAFLRRFRVPASLVGRAASNTLYFLFLFDKSSDHIYWQSQD